MRKLMYFATALLVLASCNNKDNALNNAPEGTPFKQGQQVTLTVGTGDNAHQVAPRRVAGTDSGTQINFTWEEGDQILVKVGDKSAEFTLNSEPGSAYGEFTGTMPADGSTFDIQYPTETPDLSAQVYTAEKTIPADKMLFTATGCTLGNTATLYAQNAMVQLNLYGTDKTVGKIVFTNKTASPAVSYTLNTGGKTIGTTSTEATPFYMVVPAGEYMFEVEVWDAATTPAKICSFATSAAKTFVAGECMNMPAKEVADPYNGHDYVDLGLSVKWATMNVGATTPEGYGDYFAWGETEPYYADTTTNPITWKTGRESGYDWKSYCGQSDFVEWSTPPYDATTKILTPEYDAATANWGGIWRMPTRAEQDELRGEGNCKWEWKENYNGTGVNGYLVTSLISGYMNNSIFLPASGFSGIPFNSFFVDGGEGGYYWSSSLNDENDMVDADFLFFASDDIDWNNSFRCSGLSVRPVCPAN